jgi:hypothetical protein
MPKYIVNDNGVDREMTVNEVEVYETMLAEKQAQKDAQVAALATKATARQALLEKLGITEEEAQLLLGGI